MLFGQGPVEIAIILIVGGVLEVLLLWIATGLADTPEISWGKLTPIGVGVFLGCFAIACVIAWVFGVLQHPTAADHRTAALTAMGLTLVAALVAPMAVYPSLLSVSLQRGMWVSVFQWLLRLFLYVLIIAVVMVIIAVLQIARGS